MSSAVAVTFYFQPTSATIHGSITLDGRWQVTKEHNCTAFKTAIVTIRATATYKTVSNASDILGHGRKWFTDGLTD
jgi:ethanolamine utilization microcompartment shell protein EutL